MPDRGREGALGLKPPGAGVDHCHVQTFDRAFDRPFDREAEAVFLNERVADYGDDSPYSRLKKEAILGLVERHLDAAGPGGGGNGLQLGCAGGFETRRLEARLDTLTVVDGASLFIERLSARSRSATTRYVCSLFEDFHAGTHESRYDVVFCTYVLEHVLDPRLVLANARSLLAPGGRVFVVVPNGLALSRRIALELGMLGDLEDLTPNDLRHGHRRVYRRESLVADVTAAGLRVVEVRGVILKILADFQLNDLLAQGFLTAAHIAALQRLAEQGEENARLADSIFLVAAAG